MSPDGRPAFLSPPAQRRQSRVWPDRAHRQKHRWPGPDCPHPNSHLTAREITCSDCGLRQRQSASSNPPAESLKNHIIEGVFTQPGSISDSDARDGKVRSTPKNGPRRLDPLLPEVPEAEVARLIRSPRRPVQAAWE